MQLKVLKFELSHTASCMQLGCVQSAEFFMSKAMIMSMSVRCAILVPYMCKRFFSVGEQKLVKKTITTLKFEIF